MKNNPIVHTLMLTGAILYQLMQHLFSAMIAICVMTVFSLFAGALTGDPTPFLVTTVMAPIALIAVAALAIYLGGMREFVESKFHGGAISFPEKTKLSLTSEQLDQMGNAQRILHILARAPLFYLESARLNIENLREEEKWEAERVSK